jgi:hypothetical protein
LFFLHPSIDDNLEHDRQQRQPGEQRSHGERGGELVFQTSRPFGCGGFSKMFSTRRLPRSVMVTRLAGRMIFFDAPMVAP